MRYFVLILTILSLKLTAGGYVGGSFSYEDLGNGRFAMIAVMVSDCNDCISDCPAPTGYLEIGLTHVSLRLTMIKDSDVTVLSSCANCTRCSDPSCAYGYGYKRYIYSDTVDFSKEINNSQCLVTGGVSFYSLGNFSTLDPTFKSVYIPIEFNACIENQPLLEMDLEMKNCQGQAYEKFMVSNDKDGTGDKHIFNLAEPMHDSANAFTYIRPYSYQAPLSYQGFPRLNLNAPAGIGISSSTASIKFTSIRTESAFVRIEDKEYRNGKIISITYRDYFVNTDNCNGNGTPRISNPDNCMQFNGNSTVDACVGQLMQLSFCSFDPDKTDSVFLSWNNGIPGATFLTDGSEGFGQVALLQYTPTEADLAKGNLHFTIYAKDNHCGSIPAQSSRGFTVKLNASPKLEIEKADSLCGKIEIHITNKSVASVDLVTLELGDETYFQNGDEVSFNISGLLSGEYPFSVSAGGTGACSAPIVFDTVRVNGTSPIKVNPIHFNPCQGDSIKLVASDYLRTVKQFKWLDNQSNDMTRDLGAITEDAHYQFIAENGDCLDTGFVDINLIELSPDFASDYSKGNSPMVVNFQNKCGEDAFLFTWLFGDAAGTMSTDENPIFTYYSLGDYTVTLMVADENLTCFDTIVKPNYISVWPVSVDENPTKTEVLMFPNPAKDILHLNSVESIYMVQLFNITGKLIFSVAPNTKQFDLNVTDVEAGSYMVKVLTNEGLFISRVAIHK